MRSPVILGLCIGVLTWISVFTLVWGGHRFWKDKQFTLELIRQGISRANNLEWRQYWGMKYRETIYPWMSQVESTQLLLQIMGKNN